MTDNRFLKYFSLDLKRVSSRYLSTLLILGTVPISLAILVGLYGVIFTGEWAAMGAVSRLVIFFLSVAVFIISLPVSSYGYITNKDAGSEWILIPASGFEKFASMNLVTLVIAPFLFFVLYIFCDFLMVTLGVSSGDALITMNVNDYTGGEVYISQYVLLYVSYALHVLLFLLGAIFFRKVKVVFTILCIIGLNIIFGTAVSLVAVNCADEITEMFQNLGVSALERIANITYWVSSLVQIGVVELLIYLRVKKITQ